MSTSIRDPLAWGRYLAVAGAYAACYELTRNVSFSHWMLPAGLRLACLLLVPRRYWPALPDRALTPAYAGCRPKLSRRGEPAADFRIDGPAEHGITGLINLFGIESPGLTASLAIAEHVAALLK